MQTLLSVGPRLLVQVFLLTAFLYFFGFPAVARFAKKGVMVVETSKDTSGIPIPAITVSAMGQISGDTCFHRNASIEDCLEENTLYKSDILKGNAILGMKRQKKINLTKELVTEDFTSTWAGRYFTLRLPFKIGPDSNQDQFYLGLNTNLTYTVFVHDPEYFYPITNPIALPTTLRKFNSNSKPQSRSPLLEAHRNPNSCKTLTDVLMKMHLSRIC